ncbi:hypothetical protein ACNCW9_004814 [Escherichia coli]|uniref:hypothetical protein n=1 Tax=Escherichia coli TaxID=562 RepID=UPI000B274B3B|nr:hypothetical protein [Escherichia coli]EEQ7746527.1 hypothetical protein [Escherichia coli]EEQ9007909.1 hypothetical protein [Escherichia coli]EEV6372693.1 hypothetical protein [Escherichia coli]EEV8156394.1 hypothetical protein [Escherichia coli]EGN9562487.1 hypothetical protein [Escherichia coli]
MNNESEKAMWRCKPVDNPWTFSSFAKKVICSVLPDTQPSLDAFVNSKNSEEHLNFSSDSTFPSCPDINNINNINNYY